MKKLDLSGFFRGGREQQNRIAVKGGTYSLALTAIVLAILIVVNIFTALLGYKQYESRRKRPFGGREDILGGAGG